MADIKFSEFPKANQSKDSDEIAILQDGVNKMIPSPVLESKIINKTVSRVIQQGGASLNVINLKGVVPTYADLALITPTPELNDAYQVEADGLVYVYTEDGFQAEGEGFVVQPQPNGVVEEGNTQAVSGGEVFDKTLTKEVFLKKGDNLADPLKFIAGGMVRSTGEITTNSTPSVYAVTDFIPISEGQSITINKNPSNASAYFALYDASKEYVTGTATKSKTLNYVSGAAYAVFSVLLTDEDIMVNYGSSELPYEPYVGYKGIKPEYLEVETTFSDSHNPISGYALGEYVPSKNKINKENIVMTPYFSPNQNSMWNSTTTVWRGVWVDDGFEVGESYIISGRGNRSEVAFFGEDRVIPISWVQSDSFTVPLGTEAIFINIDNTDSDAFNDTVMMRLSSENDDYKPYGMVFMLRKDITQVTQENNPEPSVLDIVLNIPDVIPAVIDDNLQLYRNGVVLLPDLYSYDCTFVCTEGRNFPRLFELKPTSVGNVNATFNVKNQLGDIVKSKAFQIQKYDELTSPATQKNILVVGASATANGYFTAELNRRLTTTTGDGTPINPTGLGLTNIDFVGRKTALGVNLEATGGWAWRDYTTQGRPAYRFYVTDVDSINIDDTYTVNGVNLTVTETNITGGIGNIRCTYTGSNTVPASGILTRVTGTGDSSITYNSYDSESFNPFWNNGGLDFQNYANEYCNGNIDILITHCGVNDMFTARTIDQIFEDIKIFADALFLDFPNCKLIITSLPLPSPNGGMGQSYGAANGRDYYSKALRFSEFFEKAEQLQMETEYNGKIFHCPVVSQFDNDHSYPTTIFNVNNRSSETYTRGTNGVHPTENGAKLIADAIYRTLHLSGL